MCPGWTNRMMEPREEVEPTTYRLRIDCTTTELPRPCFMTIAPAKNHCQFDAKGLCREMFSGRRGTSPSRRRCPPGERERTTRECISCGLLGGDGLGNRRPRK